MKNLSITTRILLIALLPAFLVTIILSGYIIGSRVSELNETESRRIRSFSASLALASEYGFAFGNKEILGDLAKSARAVQSIQRIRFLSQTETLLEVDLNQPQHAKPGPIGKWIRSWLTDKPMLNEIQLPVTQTETSAQVDLLIGEENDSVPEADSVDRLLGFVQIETDHSVVYQEQVNVIERALLIALGTLVLISIAAWMLANTVSEPIKQVTEAVRSLTKQSYPEPLPVEQGGELSALSQGVNDLSRELQSFHNKLKESTRIATTDLHQALRALEQQFNSAQSERKRAESASAFKSEFLANMSHEIRTPMNSIMGWLSLLEKSRLDTEQRTQVRLIDQSAKDLLKLMNEILDLSRIESGSVTLEYIETDLEQLLHEVAQTAVPQAVSKGIELFVSAVPDERFRCVRCDQLRVKQVLLNLINNAIKFTHSGHVLLDVSVNRLDAKRGEFCFVVEDTGIGISEGKLDRLFEAFRQADMSTTRMYGGSGLGLHISREIVSLMQGSIDVNSQLGAGTTFTVSVELELVSKSSAPKRDMALLPTMHYIDTYAALDEQNRLQLVNAGVDLSFDDEPDYAMPMIFNLSNALLRIDWQAELPADFDQWQQRFALVSHISSGIGRAINKAGFDGYIVRTPNLGLLNDTIRRVLARQNQRDESGFGYPGASGEAAAQDLPPLNILLLDDQVLNLSLMEQFFNTLQVSCVLESAWVDIMDPLSQQRFDLIILDLYLPEKDGFQIAYEIRTQAGINAQTPLVALTADAFERTREKALAAGFDEVMTKPVALTVIEDLLERVRGGQFQINRRTPIPPVQQSAELKSSAVVNFPVAAANSEFSEPAGADFSAVPDEKLVSVQAITASVIDDRNWVINALRVYAQDVEGYKRDLVDSLNKRDRVALHATIHSIKGISELCRISRVVESARVLEAGCKLADWSSLDSEIDRLLVLLDRVAYQCRLIVNAESSESA